MKFVAYYRVSTKGQDYGLDAQRQAVSRYVASVEGDLIASFEEKESGANNDRAELAAALKMAKSKGARLIIAKLDRLSRNAAFLLQLQDSGVDFLCCDMPSADRFTIGILALVAQRERELISERTRAGLAVAKARGVKLGCPVAATAWEKAATAIQARKNAFAADAVQSIEEIRSTGIASLNRIADCMNKRGERTARGGTWTAKAVSRILVICQS